MNEAFESVSNQIASSQAPKPEDREAEHRDDPEGSSEHDHGESDKKRYKYCCRRCKHTEKGRKACVCVVPLTQRRTQLGDGGCQTCSCIGCSVEDFVSRGEDPEYKPSDKPAPEAAEGFQARNGCCRKCMKAFSKTNKACLCQVPRVVRKNELPSVGCKYCGCQGCNPEDKKTEDDDGRRRLSDDDSEQRERPQPRYYHSSDSEQEEVFSPQQYNFDNFERSAIGAVINSEYRLYGPMLGFGIPQRTYSYILGRPPRR